MLSASCSFLEIYQDEVFDLLGPGEKLKVREHPVQGAFVEGLTQTSVSNAVDAQAVLSRGHHKRQGESYS